MLYQDLFLSGKKFFALLIDPEVQTPASLKVTARMAADSDVDIILVGGSLTSWPLDASITLIKEASSCPVVLFPGNLMQLSAKADGMLLISLLSGRNPDLLIGNHVLASQFLKKSGIELISTGYILVDGNRISSVEYISNTKPIPAEKTDIIAATALAGEQLGLKLIYLEAGSGANVHISEKAIQEVKKNISIPLLVGGGIKSPQDIHLLYQAGANGVVVGTAVENNLKVLQSLAAVKHHFNQNRPDLL